MKAFRIALIFLTTFSPWMDAATVAFLPIVESVIIPSRVPGEPPTILPPRSDDLLNIDIDGDGLPEITTFVTTADSSAFSFKFGTLRDSQGLLDDIFPFQAPNQSSGVTSGATFASAEALLGSAFSVFSLSLPFYTDRYSAQGAGITGLSPSNPVGAKWMLGTSGRTNGQPSSLVGIVVDYSAYFNSGGVDPVLIHTRNYGLFAPGETTPFFSLLATGIPEPSVLLLFVLSGAAAAVHRTRLKVVPPNGP